MVVALLFVLRKIPRPPTARAPMGNGHPESILGPESEPLNNLNLKKRIKLDNNLNENELIKLDNG